MNEELKDSIVKMDSKEPISKDIAEDISGRSLIFYDGVCGLCNHFVKFVLSNTADKPFVFASLQSEFASKRLQRHGIKAADLDTVYVQVDGGEPDSKVLSRSDAIVHILRGLKAPMPQFATILNIIPRPLRDLGYRLVAKIRYRLFGKYDTCLLPSAGEAEKFIEI
ncbi:MAG TPA: DCC1-like thiol-disulfide oxidoreductase family protein [Candidatus Melainabacteria bacterium]|nr:DCC1-like thiol-disulfide oxidoreductase family protein [Candidatus Melainabacteria bacterium]